MDSSASCVAEPESLCRLSTLLQVHKTHGSDAKHEKFGAKSLKGLGADPTSRKFCQTTKSCFTEPAIISVLYQALCTNCGVSLVMALISVNLCVKISVRIGQQAATKAKFASM